MRSILETAVEEAVEKAVKTAVENALVSKNTDLAKQMVLEGLDKNLIAKLTGLSVAQIQELK